jgi:DNA polymerase (family 10)
MRRLSVRQGKSYYSGSQFFVYVIMAITITRFRICVKHFAMLCGKIRIPDSKKDTDPMTMSNKEIAQIFANIADILEIQGESKFRFLSYRRAAETIEELPRDLQSYAAENSLEEIQGVGKAIAGKVRELLQTGRLEFYEQRKAEVPLGVLDIMRINGVGPRKAKLFWDSLGITSVEQLQAAAEQGKLRDLAGMGEKSEQKVLEGIQSLSRRSDRTPIGKARPAAERILQALLELPQVEAGIIAGSIRRGRPTIGDVDILIASSDPAPIMERFVSLDGVARILGQGDTKSSVELQSGLQVDVRVLPKAKWGTALQYFTGSQAHNIRIREIARNLGYSLNEDALRPLDEHGQLIDDPAAYRHFDSEESLYAALGLPWIAPEIREDTGEIEAAKEVRLPNLITIEDMRGDLHMHTTYSDGRLSIREMALEALQRGKRFIVITDHSQASAQARGLNARDLLAQQEEVRRIAAEFADDLCLLHGSEVDIRSDGALDYPDDVLKQLDFVVASLHISLQQNREQITHRLLTAIANPHVDCIGHPTARLIGKRDPVQVDMDAVIHAAAKHGTALEINSNPERLDLDGQYARLAMERDVLLAINTDAHSAAMMDYLPYGIITARRGWVTADRVINTWTVERFLEWVRARG